MLVMALANKSTKQAAWQEEAECSAMPKISLERRWGECERMLR